MKQNYLNSVRMKKQKKFFLMIKNCLVLFLFCFSLSITFAENKSDLHLSIDKVAGSTDDIFTLNIALKKASDENYFSLENLQIPGLENFQVRGNTSATNVQIVNGKVAAVAEKKLHLQPIKEGDFTLGPVKIESDSGKIIQSESVELSIKKSLTQKTKDTLLAPLEKLEDSESEDDLLNKFTNKQIAKNIPVSKPKWDQENVELFDSEKIKMEDFTNWYFWGQLFVGIFLFLIGAFVGGKFLTK